MAAPEETLDLMRYLDASPTPYHAVAEGVRRLEAAGFSALDERDAWSLAPGDRRYVVRSGGTLLAFVCGAEPAERAGFVAVGAHTDSPNFRVKPRPDVKAAGYRQIGVEVYGGVLLYTWLDRDLSLAGRVSLATGETRLVDLATPVARMPSLAIHLQRTVNTDGLVLNPQKHTVPVLSLLESAGDGPLARLVASALDVEADAIAGMDLCVYDVQRAALGGAAGDLLSSARLDNLASCHAALTALITAGAPGASTRVIALWDHEEVGSQSDAGARSRFVAGCLARVARSLGGGAEAAERAFARSLLVSADMAHAVHPGHSDKHDARHEPALGKGPVIKVNASQSYATDGPATAVFEGACRAEGFAAQRFVSRADLPCGSTIGPISAALMGVRTIDVGNPMLSMHSCRETAGAEDVPKMIAVLRRVLRGVELPAPSA